MGPYHGGLEIVELGPVDAELLVPAQQLHHCAEPLGRAEVLRPLGATLPGIDGQQLQGVLGGQA